MLLIHECTTDFKCDTIITSRCKNLQVTHINYSTIVIFSVVSASLLSYSAFFSSFSARQRENNERTLLLVFATLSEFLLSYNVCTKQTAVLAVAKSVEASISSIA